MSHDLAISLGVKIIIIILKPVNWSFFRLRSKGWRKLLFCPLLTFFLKYGSIKFSSSWHKNSVYSLQMTHKMNHYSDKILWELHFLSWVVLINSSWKLQSLKMSSLWLCLSINDYHCFMLATCESQETDISTTRRLRKLCFN